MQNHLTEMMALVAMELPDNSGNITDLLHSKVRVLRQVRPADRHSVVVGQYSTYNTEWMKEQDLTNNVSTTPTYAASVLFVDNSRWNDIPFVLMSGKKMDEKSSYVRVKFRNSRFCTRVSDDACNWQRQLVFRVASSDAKLPPMIAISRGLPTPKFKSGWKEVTSKSSMAALFGQNAKEMVHLIPEDNFDPYVELLEAVMIGSRHFFVPADNIHAAWEIWTPVLDLAATQRPRQYLGRNKDAERLDFVVSSRGIRFQYDDKNIIQFGDDHGPELLPDFVQVPAYYRNATLVSGSEREVVSKLATEIRFLVESPELTKRNFHLALSGGQSPTSLFERLAEMSLPWQRIHLWLVDERCTELAGVESNFQTLQRHLLNHISIPYLNIHPIPVDASDEVCSLKPAVYRADVIYENALRRLIPELTFDFIVLGLGADGHTASLFPNQPVLRELDHLVVYSDATATSTPGRRTTLTFPVLNSAKNVAVLVLGSGKHDILKSIDQSTDVNLYPITGVKPNNGTLTWYIDYAALLGSVPQ